MKNDRKKILKIVIVVCIAALLIFGLVRVIAPYLKLFHNSSLIREWIMGFGKFSILAYVILHTVIVVSCLVPGEVIQAAGGYLFGTFGGTGLSLVGLLAGSIITFLIGRLFGENLLEKVLPQKHFLKMKSLVNKPQNRIVIFALYLIPGIPKDILGYVSGITSIKMKEFAVICIVARIPGVVMSTFFGANLYHKNYKILVIMGICVLVLLVLGISQKQRILSYISNPETYQEN